MYNLYIKCIKCKRDLTTSFVLYRIMTFRNNKTNIWKLLAITFSLLLLPIGFNLQANAQTTMAPALDDNYYVQQYVIVYKQLDQLIKGTSDLQKQVSDLKAANISGNEGKIQQLQQQVDSNTKKMKNLVAELDHIQDESRALFKVDPATKKKLDDAQTALYNLYMNKKSPTYVGDNPVQEAVANYEYKDLWVIFDPDKTINNPAGDQSKAIIEDMKKVVGDIPIKADYFKMHLTQCTTRYQQCSPLVAGTAIQASSKTFPCTEGYQALDYLGRTGFITAGHCGLFNDAVTQPPPGYGGSRQVGTINQRADSGESNCIKSYDFNFVLTSASTSTWIFKDGNGFYVMHDKIPQSSQSLGTIVIQSGIGSNIISGAITQNDPNTHRMIFHAGSQSGDSGSPVFQSIDGTNVHMFGEAYCTGGGYTWYFPEDFIANTFGLTG